MIFRPATQADVNYITNNVRMEDLREARTATGNPETMSELRTTWRNYGQVYSAEVGNKPAVLMGAIPQGDGSAQAWLIGTPRCEDKPVALLRECRLWVNRWHSRWRPLWNVVDVRNDTHVRWIEAAGFELLHRVILNEHPFLYFQKS